MGVGSVAVKMKSMFVNYFAVGEHVNDEEEGTEHQTLGNSMGDRRGGRF